MQDISQKLLIETTKAIREAYIAGFKAGKKEGTVRIVSDTVLTCMAGAVAFGLLIFVLNL